MFKKTSINYSKEMRKKQVSRIVGLPSLLSQGRWFIFL